MSDLDERRTSAASVSSSVSGAASLCDKFPLATNITAAAPIGGKLADTNIDNMAVDNCTSHYNPQPSRNLPLEAAIRANYTTHASKFETCNASMEHNFNSIAATLTPVIGMEKTLSRPNPHHQSRTNHNDHCANPTAGYASLAESNLEPAKNDKIFISSPSAEKSERQRQLIQMHDRNRSDIQNAQKNGARPPSLRDVRNSFQQKLQQNFHLTASSATLDQTTSTDRSSSLPSHHSNLSSQEAHHRRYLARSHSSTSDSGSDDGGYAGSASSNDDAGGGSSATSTSCSSPSFYEDQRYCHIYDAKDHRRDREDLVRASGGISCNDHHHHADTLLSDSKRSLKRMKRNVSFSSDIADFSSSSTSVQHCYDESGRGRGDNNTHNELAGTKTTGLSSDESGSDEEEYTFRQQQQRRRFQLKKPREYTKQRKQQKQQQQQQQLSMDTAAPMTKLKQGRKRRNNEDGRQSLMSTHSTSLTKLSYQGSNFSSTTTSCNSNSTFSHRPSKRIEQHHKDLKATFQSALKQLDHNFNCSTSNTISYSSSVNSAYLSTAASDQQFNAAKRTGPSIKSELRPESNSCSSNNYDSVNEMYVRSSNTISCSQQRTATRDTTQSVIYNIGTDVMANIMSYLEPEAVHTILGMPLSKTWRSAFTVPQDLWKVLCLSAPFHAKFDGENGGHDQDIDENWFDSHNLRNPVCSNLETRQLLGHYRVLFSSFIKCMRYLERIKEDVLNNRTPKGIEECRRDNIDANNRNETSSHPFNDNSNLNNFFAKAREVKQRGHHDDVSKDDEGVMKKKKARSYVGVEVISRHDRSEEAKKKGKPGVKFGHSKLTQRLLGPVHASGVAGHVNLPPSCAIYSVVNWMVAFTDVAGIQNMCLKILPNLLEDEKQRTSAQHAGLTDIVLRAMVLFPCITELHTAAFHTLVLLARPLGGKEGMLFHRSMVNSSGIFNVGSNTGKSGIAVMLDSMKRFSSDEDLQAMGCWSMVNIALIPSQKVVLVKLGGIFVAVNALMQHPHSAEVHFRALFALINLVIPSENLPEKSAEATTIQKQVGGINETSEKDMLDESVVQIANLVVVSMKNFWSSEAILNRACLVLHNLSLNETYHRVLLWTPNCYQMLEWCIGNYRHDAVLQQSAGGTLQRLQMTLANDVDLRQKFTESIRAQQQFIS